MRHFPNKIQPLLLTINESITKLYIYSYILYNFYNRRAKDFLEFRFRGKWDQKVAIIIIIGYKKFSIKFGNFQYTVLKIWSCFYDIKIVSI